MTDASATTEAATPTNVAATPAIFGFLLEKAQDVNARYALVENANGVLENVNQRYPTLAVKAGETYSLAKTYVPEEFHERVESYEKEICGLKNKENLSLHAQNLDSTIHSTIQVAQVKTQQVVDNVQEKRQQVVDNVQEKTQQLVDNVQEKTQQLVVNVQEKRQQLVDNVVSVANEQAITGMSLVATGIDMVDSTVDYVDSTVDSFLPEEDAVDAEEKPVADTASPLPEKQQSVIAPSEHITYVAQKAMVMSKKAQRRLQKKALEGLKDLRLRTQAIGAVDLIQYNRFLDIDTVMEGAAAVSKDVKQFAEGTRGLGEVLMAETIGKAVKVYEDLEGELVVAVKPVWENLEGKINAVVVEPAREFYTTVVQEFLNNPTAAFKDFKASVEKAVGEKWTEALEEPTMELWGSMKGAYGNAPGNVEAIVANVGKRLSEAWGQTGTAAKPMSRSDSTARLADLATHNDGFPFQKIVPGDAVAASGEQ
jgi:hypothetical protein